MTIVKKVLGRSHEIGGMSAFIAAAVRTMFYDNQLRLVVLFEISPIMRAEPVHKLTS